MQFDPQPYDPDPAGRASPKGSWKWPRAGIALGITLFLGMAGAGLAFAVGGGGGHQAAALSASSSTSSTSVARPPGGHWHMGMGVRPAFGPGGPGVVHGQYTVRNGSGFRTMAVQTGQVTKVSSASLTVKSPDGFIQAYTVEPSTVVDSQSGGISAVAPNDTVSVQAIVNGSKQTATNVVDITKVGDSRRGFGLTPGPAKGDEFPGGGAPPTAAA
jgi:hypothetical protein